MKTAISIAAMIAMATAGLSTAQNDHDAHAHPDPAGSGAGPEDVASVADWIGGFDAPPCDPATFCQSCIQTCVVACLVDAPGSTATATCQITHDSCTCVCQCIKDTATAIIQ